MNNKNIILTGLPRSGTTLTCHLLNKLPNTVALHEPMKVKVFSELGSQSAICNNIYRFFDEMRRSISSKKAAISRQVAGKVPDNPFHDKYSINTGLRQSKVSNSIISIEKKLSEDFILVVKHPAAFTALLDILVHHFPCYALIRNPLSILCSWNCVAAPFEKGHVPAAEALDSILASALANLEDKIDRQLYILSWFFDKYRRVLPEESIVSYENVVASGGKALSVITPNAKILDEKLENKNRNNLYDTKMMHLLGERLLKTDGVYWNFYNKESVEMLLK